ncbi:hypothetical protein PISMIDRAFT_26640 [Pisolithus microcarpus 441]|uniref:Uncharacterized protein n=1 Tax=Pisolithus microcarpus 441 TaxID=765257 RepID=A0A0C9YYC0_9AGAM|nr:hypothetical protein PISMIDRAFT_26640 [Pisolithus microcarpus 441]
MLTASFRPPSGGWYVRPPPTQHRGRSRQISAAAKARVASEERRTRLLDELQQQQPQQQQQPSPQLDTMTPSLLLRLEPVASSDSTNTADDACPPTPIEPSVAIPLCTPPSSASERTPSLVPDSSVGSADSSASASLSSDPYDSPPSPPSSLEDQIQVAYALDDIRLAKTLLLKLKGIDVTSDDDPRIDQVRDEDFDVYFVPSGPLVLEEADRKAMEETQRKQREWAERSQRSMRLKACERVWEEQKQRLQADKLAAVRRRERQLAAAEDERRRAVQRQQRYSRTRIERYSYSNPTREETVFQYSFMVPTKLTGPTATRQFAQSPKVAGKQAVIESPRPTVCFKEVIKSMNGRLFPPDVSEQVEDARRIAGLSSSSNSTRHRRRTSARAELLDDLLQPVERKADRRKAPASDPPRRRAANLSQSVVRDPAPIPSLQSSESLTSISSPLSSRSNSWFSFGSWRSSCTDVTIPDAQMATPSDCSLPVLLPSLHESQRDYHYPRCSFVPISLEDSPLIIPRPLRSKRHTSGDNYSSVVRADSPSDSKRQSFLHRVSCSVAGLVEAARHIQTAYVHAALLTVGPPVSANVKSPQHPPHQRRRSTHPEGYRACTGDVKKFTSPDPTTTATHVEPVLFIPLVNLAPRPPSFGGLPRNRLLTTDAIIIPSPLRPRTPPAVLAYRLRPIANPAVLRLRALQNLMCARGKEWEGRAREGGLGCGKDRMFGVAFEGRGRSGLGCEVRFAVA